MVPTPEPPTPTREVILMSIEQDIRIILTNSYNADYKSHIAIILLAKIEYLKLKGSL